MNNQTRPQTRTPSSAGSQQSPGSQQSSGSQSGSTVEKAKDVISGASSTAVSSASSMAQDAAEKAKQAASDTTATITGEVKGLLDRQVGGGARMLGLMARSARRAADDLHGDAPQIAGLLRTVGSQMDSAAEGLKDQSIEGMWRTAADFTRRQPALVFGLAALAGFFALRTVKSASSSAPSISAPSIQPSQDYYSGRTGGYYGP